MTNTEQKILADAVTTYGVQSQVEQMVEECAEFIAKVNQRRRGRIDMKDLIEEMVDVEIMVKQMKLIFGGPEWLNFELDKMTRLEQRINKTRENRDDTKTEKS